jgi:hypothetical protein
VTKKERLDPHVPASPDDQPRPFAEKRKHPRHQVSIRCWIGDGRHTVYLRLHDLSLGGLSVRASVPFPPHRELELSLELPHHGRVRARGRVVWVRPATDDSGDGPRMGAEFVEFLAGEDHLAALLAG